MLLCGGEEAASGGWADPGEWGGDEADGPTEGGPGEAEGVDVPEDVDRPDGPAEGADEPCGMGVDGEAGESGAEEAGHAWTCMGT
jgi:hypothetical protein